MQKPPSLKVLQREKGRGQGFVILFHGVSFRAVLTVLCWPLAPCVKVCPGPGEQLVLAVALSRTSLSHGWVSPVDCGGLNHIWGTQLSFCYGCAALWIAAFWWCSPFLLMVFKTIEKLFITCCVRGLPACYPHFPTSAESCCILSRKTGMKYLIFFLCVL